MVAAMKMSVVDTWRDTVDLVVTARQQRRRRPAAAALPVELRKSPLTTIRAIDLVVVTAGRLLRPLPAAAGSPSGADAVTADDDKSGSYGYGRTGGGYSRTTTTTISDRSSPGGTDGDKSGSYGYGRTGGGYSRTTTTTISSGRGSPGGTSDVTADDKTGSYGQSSITTTTSKSSGGPMGGSSWSSSSSSSRVAPLVVGTSTNQRVLE